MSGSLSKKMGRSSSPVGYGIGIAEVVGSNPTRSTINYYFLIPVLFDKKFLFYYNKDAIYELLRIYLFIKLIIIQYCIL
jgi:hypothetical protein